MTSAVALRWSGATHACAACGNAVDLTGGHYDVSMNETSAGQTRRRDDDELVFCRTRCLDRWA